MSPIAAEGLYGELDPNGLICKDNMEFAAMAVQLYLNESWWHEAQQNGYEVVERRYDYSAFAKALSHKIKLTINKPPELNFTQRMLNYHGHNALKFKSRWIEQKSSND